MAVFGPKYPEPLQAVIDHAERLCACLARLEGRHPDPHLWLVGRREEIELVLRLRIRDWKARRISVVFAARSIGAYLDELHTAARNSLGLAASVLLSCRAQDEPTIRSINAESLTEPSGVGRTSTLSDADTRNLSALRGVGRPGAGVARLAAVSSAEPGVPQERSCESRASKS